MQKILFIAVVAVIGAITLMLAARIIWHEPSVRCYEIADCGSEESGYSDATLVSISTLSATLPKVGALKSVIKYAEG